MIDLQSNSKSDLGNPEDESTEGKQLNDQQLKAISKSYLDQIKQTQKTTKRAKKVFLCPVGLVGAGKTTVLKPISEYFGFIRVSGDDIRRLLKEGGFNLVRTNEIFSNIINHLVKDNHSIAVDADCASPNVSRAVEKVADENGYKVLYIHVNPPEEFILDKLKNFNHTWLFKDADDALHSYYRRKPLHENLSTNFIYAFDTSRSDLEDQIQEAISHIGKSLN